MVTVSYPLLITLLKYKLIKIYEDKNYHPYVYVYIHSPSPSTNNYDPVGPILP